MAVVGEALWTWCNLKGASTAPPVRSVKIPMGSDLSPFLMGRIYRRPLPSVTTIAVSLRNPDEGYSRWTAMAADVSIGAAIW